MRLFILFYFCAGVGYVVSATFIEAIVDQLHGLQGKGTWVFLVVGLAASPARIIWDLVARRNGDLNALLSVSILQVVGILLPLICKRCRTNRYELKSIKPISLIRFVIPFLMTRINRA